jgi:hypothetical protein
MKRLFAFAAIVAAGCSSPLMVRAPVDWADVQSGEIYDAGEAWALIKPEKRIRFGEGGWAVVPGTPPGGWNGYADRKRKVITIRPEAPVFQVALHELGHALGLGHLCTGPEDQPKPWRAPCVPGGPSLGVMDPIRASAGFTALDIAECRRAGVCR